MKVNLKLLKGIIRLLILLILFVMLFMISAFLYSAKFWPDFYTYINANITIKRIPTISELNITIIQVPDFTTDYPTTDYTESTDYDDSTGTFEDFFKDIEKREVKIEEISKDYIELPKHAIVNYVFDVGEVTTEIIRDTINESGLTTTNSKDVEIMTGFSKTGIKICELTNDSRSPVSIFAWVATIFIRNESNNQFDYYCDGVLLSEYHVLTAARCLTPSNLTAKPDDVLVFLGKRSLQSTGEGETILRVKQLQIHENFTAGQDFKNDLAMLKLEDPVVFSSRIQAACLADDDETQPGVTTAWDADLSIVSFLEKRTPCKEQSEYTFCASFSDALPLCPSYGGIYASYSSSWCLQGIRSADPVSRGYCLEKNIAFTDLSKYRQWIDSTLMLI